MRDWLCLQIWFWWSLLSWEVSRCRSCFDNRLSWTLEARNTYLPSSCRRLLLPWTFKCYGSTCRWISFYRKWLLWIWVKNLCGNLLGFYPHQSEIKKNGILASTLINRMAREPLDDDLEDEAYIQRARMIVLVLLEGLILPDGSGYNIPLMWLTILRDVGIASMISWASATLTTLYHNICEASMGKKKDIGGPTGVEDNAHFETRFCDDTYAYGQHSMCIDVSLLFKYFVYIKYCFFLLNLVLKFVKYWFFLYWIWYWFFIDLQKIYNDFFNCIFKTAFIFLKPLDNRIILKKLTLQFLNQQLTAWKRKSRYSS